MNRDISRVDEAIKSIEIWFSNTSLMHQGNKLFSSHADQDLKQPKFAKWYYGEGMIYASLESYKIIEKYYKNCFEAYVAYNKLYRTPVKKGFFTSNTKRNNELGSLIYDFQEKINVLIKSVEFFKKRLLALPLKQEITLPKPIIAKTTIDTKNSNKTAAEIDYEKKLYKEVAKVKNKLEQEYQSRIEAEKATLNSITLTSKKGGNTQNDIDEEIRRILS